MHLCVGTQELQERYRLSSAPKIGKRCPMGTENVSCPEGKQKPRKQRNKIWEDRAVTPLRKIETDWVWLDLFHSCFGTDFRQLCFWGWTRQNHWLLGLLTAVNSMHASSAQVFLSLSGVFLVRAYYVKINHWPFLHVLPMWQGNQNRGHRQSSLYRMHKMCHTIHFV